MTPEALLAAAGALRTSYEEVDWSQTALGPIEDRSPALRNAVDLALNTQFPVTLFRGPAFILVYNEAYVELIADKHPAALGTPAREVFPEAWEAIGPMMQSVLDGEGLLGIAARARTDHEEELEPGSAVVLYTDGLIERRDEPLDRGLARLVAALEGLRGLDAEAICDRLLAQLGSRRDDDVALLVAHSATAGEPPARG